MFYICLNWNTYPLTTPVFRGTIIYLSHPLPCIHVHQDYDAILIESELLTSYVVAGMIMKNDNAKLLKV